MSDALKVNTGLTELYLECRKQKQSNTKVTMRYNLQTYTNRGQHSKGRSEFTERGTEGQHNTDND